MGQPGEAVYPSFSRCARFARRLTLPREVLIELNRYRAQKGCMPAEWKITRFSQDTPPKCAYRSLTRSHPPHFGPRVLDCFCHKRTSPCKIKKERAEILANSQPSRLASDAYGIKRTRGAPNSQPSRIGRPIRFHRNRCLVPRPPVSHTDWSGGSYFTRAQPAARLRDWPNRSPIVWCAYFRLIH